MKARNAVLIVLLATSVVLGDELFRKDEHGQPVQETESQRSVADFGGWVLVTPDKDWEEKWQTPSDTTPHYNVTSKLSVGQTVMTLIFFANPAVDEAGNADIRCDLKVTRPSGSISVDLKDAECYKGPILGDPYALRLSNALLGFVGEADDERGEWITDVRLTDVVRDVSLDLRTRFVLVDNDN